MDLFSKEYKKQWFHFCYSISIKKYIYIKVLCLKALLKQQRKGSCYLELCSGHGIIQAKCCPLLTRSLESTLFNVCNGNKRTLYAVELTDSINITKAQCSRKNTTYHKVETGQLDKNITMDLHIFQTRITYPVQKLALVDM